MPGGCHAKHAEVTCPGCLPAVPDGDAVVCHKCVTNLLWALTTAPDVVEHIRSICLHPGQTVSDADDIHASIAEWAKQLVSATTLTGPTWVGSDVRPASKRRSVAGIVYE